MENAARKFKLQDLVQSILDECEQDIHEAVSDYKNELDSVMKKFRIELFLPKPSVH